MPLGSLVEAIAASQGRARSLCIGSDLAARLGTAVAIVHPGRCAALSQVHAMEFRMTVRPPKSLSPSHFASGAISALEYELLSERADALGRHGLKVEKAIAALQACEGKETSPELRERLLDDAADAVWAFFIQREICGLRDSRDAVRRYGIPKAVMARLGIVRRK